MKVVEICDKNKKEAFWSPKAPSPANASLAKTRVQDTDNNPN
jgi:hypothetical protein